MGNTEYVDKLVAEGFFDDVERLKKELPLLAASMEQLSKAGRDVNAALGSTRTLKDVVENTDKATKVNETASRTVKVLTEDTLKLNMAIKAQNDALKLNVQIAQAQDGSIAKEILLVKQLTAERNRLNLETQKGRAEELKAQIDAKNDWIKSNSDKLSAQKINIGNYPEMMAQMAAIRNEMVQMEAAGLKGTQVFADMEGKLTEISRAMGPTSAQLTSLTNSMTLLAQAGKQDTQEFKDMQQQAMALRVNMNQVKQAISGTTSSMQAQSAAARSSGQATFAVSQLLREMPSFAYSASTGILALSNNIPMLGDSIANLKQKNEELVASGQKAIPVWKSLGLAVFSVNGIITLAVSAITIIAARMAMAGNEAKGAAKNVDSLTDSLTNLHNIIGKRNASVAIAMDTELIKSQRLIDVYKNQNTVAAGKINAYNDLQSAYPKILSVLTDEELRHKKISAAHEAEISRLNDYIKVKTQIAEKDKELNASIAVRDEAISKAQRMYSIQRRRELGIEFRNAFGNQAYPDLSKIRNDNERAYFELLRTVRIEEARIARLKEEQVTSTVQLANIENVKQPKKEKQRKEEEINAEEELRKMLEYAEERGRYYSQTREQYEAEQEAIYQSKMSAIALTDRAMQDEKTKALNELNLLYENGTLTYEEHTKKKEELDKHYVKASLMMHLAYYKILEKEYPDEDRLKKLISDTEAALANIGVNKPAAKSDKNLFGMSQKEWSEAKEIFNQVLQLEEQVQKAVNAKHQREIENLERKKQLIDENYNAEVTAINGSFASEQKKSIQIAQLAAQKAAQDKAINEEIRREKRKMAQNDKIAAISTAIAQGAVAVVEALPNYILAGLVALTTAAQVAAIASTQVPQYGKGTEDHPGGPAIIGDKPEWVIEPGKTPYFTSTTHMRNLARHTRVVPQEKLLAGSMGFLTPELLQQINVGGGDNSGIERKLQENADRITAAINNKSENHFSWNNGEMQKSVKNGNSWITYLDRNF